METRQAAEDALMEALEDWARSLGEAGVVKSNGAKYFPSRQLGRSMRQAHSEGRLIESLTHWLPEYKGLRRSADGHAYANRMRDIMEHGCPLWEQVVAQEGRPWSDYVTPQQREVLNRVATDVQREIDSGRRLKARIQAEMQVRKVDGAA